MKTFNKSILSMFALATVVMASCSDNDTWNEENGPDPSKELISFSSQDGQIGTRAVFEGTRAGFSSQTKIVMRIKAEDDHNTSQTARYTKTYALGNVAMTDECNNSTLLGNSLTHSHLTFASNNYRYWDDAFGRYSKLSVYAVCVPNKIEDGILSNNILPDNGTAVDATNNPNWKTETTEAKTLEWEVPSTKQTNETIAKKDLCFSNNIRQDATENEKGIYRYSYSSANNQWSKQMEFGQMFWFGKDGKKAGVSAETIGKFDEGHLIFKHALVKYTINLTEGKGFDNTISSDFQFTNSSENVAILGVPTKGSLDFTTGTWTITESNGVSNLPEITTTDESDKNTKKRTLQAISLPGLKLKDSENSTNDNTNVLKFTIDNNEYYVTRKQIYEKIKEWNNNNNNKTPEAACETFTQGYHYEINITVGKKAIDKITAQIIDWEKVGTETITPSNTYVTMSLEDKSSETSTTQYNDSFKNKFKIYRSPQVADNIVTNNSGFNNFYSWDKGYENSDNHTYDNTNNVWKTDWFWPDNKTAYHFRIVGNAETDNDNPTVTIDSNNDYYSIASGEINGTTYNDYTWGAPFHKLNGSKIEYNINTGFDKQTTNESTTTHSQIYHAIGATDRTINMLIFHMTCQLFINVTTSKSTDPNVVKLNKDDNTNGTKVEILRFYNNGKVLLGNGLVETTGSTVTNQEITVGSYTPDDGSNPAKTEFSYGMVPQTLNRETGTNTGNEYKVGLRITTPDGNQYVIEDISTVYASVSDTHLKIPYTETSVSGSDTKYKINRWYPGYKYTYTIRITKKGIDKITAQLLDWETVTSDDIDIDLEGK